ncbi:30S ribosomal protein THX [Adhaeribacter swui]|uniref:30S ribosomal protein THX n=1 Tax=Adhaeribacter swui TaxID=2086471 RepID=A0A7G7G4D6_9BACT|nr:30S ribosomal protein THX [Adhaeribacter swui]QNF32020.1 30S ribosomal protein THX [Adhaeribacter swui]
MGKGDVKSKKGKISKGSFGNSRPRKATKDTKKEPGVVGKLVEKVKDLVK